ncbi:MAG: Abi family protein [Syntrophomonadaceae bacterium]
MELKQHQPPITIEKQIDNLKELGLVITDEECARAFLNDVSYFRLIKAYSLNLKPKNGNYNEGITFQHIVDLYLFNSNFRQLLFPQIERIEINLRCRLSNYFSNKYGLLGHENAANFADANFHKEFLNEIDEEIDRNKKAPFVRNFRQNYVDGKIPFYALIELFSFGTLSKFFKNMKNEDKKNVAVTFGIGYTYFESWIESIAFVRNICAHYGRLYNAKLVKTPTLYKQYSQDKIGNNRIFGVLLCIKHILPMDRHWQDYVDTIEMLFDKYSSVNKALMGFPENWKNYLDTR